MDEQSNYDSEETENCPRTLSESYWGDPEASTGVFVPSSKSRVFGKVTQFLF